MTTSQSDERAAGAPAAPSASGHEPRFARVPRHRRGYAVGQVDAFLARALGTHLTAEQVRRAGFDLRLGGYDVEAVDAEPRPAGGHRGRRGARPGPHGARRAQVRRRRHQPGPGAAGAARPPARRPLRPWFVPGARLRRRAGRRVVRPGRRVLRRQRPAHRRPPALRGLPHPARRPGLQRGRRRPVPRPRRRDHRPRRRVGAYSDPSTPSTRTSITTRAGFSRGTR
nr:DivIVA domain-containing protein [Angustibacter aerolatus]